ncbi:uncharacterized protein ChaoS9_115 [Halobacterium phage ChaoS9]|uniref:Uncharacterized protein n=1 Tax=Halobacterium phage ChaoS9 TaxID=2847105 RepID=A0A481V9S3_9CAUD|nr:baseplate hub [Halobacterium phage ChaoS9]QBI90030.1 uncharacterized protein ChaoS9_115 [Halobacterium phage ChaoS9]
MTRVWQQYRSVEASEVSLDGLDIDITVRKPKDDPLEFDVKVWNLTPDTWDRIDDDDLARIELGWADGNSETVCLGKITDTSRTPDKSDVEYQIEGVDESEAATHARISDTWKDRRPDQIASDIAEEIGLSASTEPAGRPIQGRWSATRDQKVRDWLDELLDYAAEFTGQDWEWFAARGQLHFVPRNQETAEAPQLSYDGMLISIGEKSSSDEDVEQELEFEAMLEPRIQKGAAVYVSTDQFEGAYRVSDYEFRSSTETGDHLVQGTLLPVEGDYSVE